MKRFLLLALIVGLLLCFGVPSESASGKPKRGGTLTMAISKKMKLMNPLVRTSSTEARIRALMFEPLVGMDQDGSIKPNLAKSWEIGQDGLLYTFHLRKGVKFHNGQEMTAADAKFAIDYSLNPKNGARGYRDLKLIKRVEVPDRYTLKIIMKKRNPAFLTSLTSIRAFSVIPKESLQEGIKKPSKFPPGTGPFRFVDWKAGQQIVMDRFEDYWGHKAFIDRLILRPISNATVRFTALRTGDVDLVERTPYEWVKQIVQGKTKGINYVSASRSGARNLEFNVADPPFNNRKLRLAVAHAINREEILQAAYLGLAVSTDQRYPKGHAWYFDEAPAPKYDLKRAKALLKESGYKGEPIELLGNRGEVAETEGAVIQAQLKKIGINVKLTILERASNLDRRRKGQYAFKLSGGRFYADPLFAYNEFLCEKDLRKRRANETGYCNKQFERLFSKAETEVLPDKRKALFKEVVTILSRDIPILAIGFTARFFTFRDDVKGFTTTYNGAFQWWAGGLNHTWLDR